MVSSSEYYFADNSDMENKKLEAAKNHYMTGDYNAALRLYLSMLNSSISYKLYHRIAKCYYKLTQYNSAQEYFEKSIGLEKENNPSYQYLGNIHYKKGDVNKAIYNWMNVFAMKPEDETINLNLATSYFSRNMRMQSFSHYEKYLQYASNKTDSYYVIKKSIDDYKKVGNEFLDRAKRAIVRKDKKGAIELLTFAVENFPTSVEINDALGTLFLEEGDSMRALVYLKQAYCLETNSSEILQKLTSVYINLGDYTSAYCTMRRLLPLVINNQAEYLKTMQVINELDSSFDDLSYLGHKTYADEYFENNNYHLALLEYENCIILKSEMQKELISRIEQIKAFLNPEPNVIKTNLKIANKYYVEGDYQTANKYFNKVIQLSSEETSEYKLAKSRLINV